MKRIARNELEKNVGKNGKPAYVAVDGKVYDVASSSMWKDGSHMNTHDAGKDLSVAIQAAPHGREVLDRVQLIGELEEGEELKASEFPQPPKPLAKILEQHPHPMSVHFPIALSITAALFMFLFLISGRGILEKAALCNIIIATIAAPFAITAGVLSWHYNYGGIWTSIYRRKAFLSGVLVTLQILALAIRGTVLAGGDIAGGWSWLYAILVLALAPTVMGLGYLGGKITFPS